MASRLTLTPFAGKGRKTPPFQFVNLQEIEGFDTTLLYGSLREQPPVPQPQDVAQGPPQAQPEAAPPAQGDSEMVDAEDQINYDDYLFREEVRADAASMFTTGDDYTTSSIPQNGNNTAATVATSETNQTRPNQTNSTSAAKSAAPAIPQDIQDLCDEIKARPRRPNGLFNRTMLAVDFDEHFDRRMHHLRARSSLQDFAGDERLFSKEEWENLMGTSPDKRGA
ncbi:uncharacterized protein LTR77_003263 [Saxophila tyrrhenica]|uniref:Uncharacterized protein n=1 Tax=Saxophila tyrrhenica TaxID=1690608 RepID=A0AAV9PHD4_9PEZI|nr:hypothetical protein LTR77_003263 [Saxophila tyrrhenica]